MHEFPGVTFHPWVGSHYGSSDNHFGFRLLVLGEFHYNDVINEGDQDPDWIAKRNSADGEHVFTQYVVRKWAQDKKNAFFTKTANVLLGRKKANRDKVNSEIWEHVSFYNYVNSYVPWNEGDNPEPPTDKQRRESKIPFETVLQSLKPDAVLMLGKALSDWVGFQHNHGNREMYQPYRYEHLNFLGIYNPRGRLSYDKANPAFEELVRLTHSQ